MLYSFLNVVHIQALSERFKPYFAGMNFTRKKTLPFAGFGKTSCSTISIATRATWTIILALPSFNLHTFHNQLSKRPNPNAKPCVAVFFASVPDKGTSLLCVTFAKTTRGWGVFLCIIRHRGNVRFPHMQDLRHHFSHSERYSPSAVPGTGTNLEVQFFIHRYIPRTNELFSLIRGFKLASVYRTRTGSLICC